MVQLLSFIWIKDRSNLSAPAVRQAYGILCSVLGIGLNLLLFLGKLLIGAAANSIAIMADAFNNLSDAGSSFITLVGFRMSGQAPDTDHPFGHGRIEYLSGLIVSGLILIMAYELILSSARKILNPSVTYFQPITGFILLSSILIKLYMAYYNYSVGKKIDSAVMKATATDSLCDTISTALVLAAALLEHWFDLRIDGYFGILIGLFILYAGIRAAKDTINPLLGQAPSGEFVEQIQSIVLHTEGILGMHDLIVHDYGPGRVIISLHAEVSAEENIMEIHDRIDQLERKLNRLLNCEAVIHMDPVLVSDEDVIRWKENLSLILQSIDPLLGLHDFRIVKGNPHTNLIFDLVIPHNYKLSSEVLLEKIQEQVSRIDVNCHVTATIEHSYI